MTNIQKSAVLVRLNISRWGGEKTTRPCPMRWQTKNAKSAGRYVKRLLSAHNLRKFNLGWQGKDVNKAQTLKYLEDWTCYLS